MLFRAMFCLLGSSGNVFQYHCLENTFQIHMKRSKLPILQLGVKREMLLLQ